MAAAGHIAGGGERICVCRHGCRMPPGNFHRSDTREVGPSTWLSKGLEAWPARRRLHRRGALW